MNKTTQTPILLIGTADSCPEIVYATGFAAPDPVAYLWAAGQSFLAVPLLEAARAGRTVAAHRRARGCRVLCANDLGKGRKGAGGPERWAYELVRLAGIRRVRVPAGFPYGAAKFLVRRGIKLSPAESIFPGRAVKDAEELRKITESQQAAVLAIRGAVAMIASAENDRAGYLKVSGERLTSECVRTYIQKSLLERGCGCPDVIVAGGLRSADPHDRGEGPLRACEPIVMDVFPRHNEHLYWGDITRTVVRGKASPRVREMYQAVRAGQKAALAQIRSGVKASTVHAAAVREMEGRGFKRSSVDGKAAGFIHSTGHGVGLNVHEAPGIGPGSDTRLRIGHVITVEPGLYYPDTGGVRIEDTVVVTKSGWRYLVPCEKRLEI